MKNFILKNRQLISGVVFGVLAIILITSLIVEKRLSNLQDSIEDNLVISANELMTLADAISRGEVNGLAVKVMPDCSAAERVQFEGRLGRLNEGLSNTELKELDNLFSRCAPVSVIRRSAMVAQFESEFKNLSVQVKQRKMLGEYSDYDEQLKTWGDLLETEKSIVDLSFESVNLQYEIILQLLSGLNVDSDSANELKNRGQSIRTELGRLVSESIELRERLN